MLMVFLAANCEFGSIMFSKIVEVPFSSQKDLDSLWSTIGSCLLMVYSLWSAL